ncbi:MAG: aminoacyl-histidine dipeptidase [Anaerovoracaceae bacterium]
MRILENLEPKAVLGYFEDICAIPHGSRNEKQLSDYLVKFATELGLEHYQDEAYNVIIIKEATKGYESAEPIILQGHIDMVCEKESGVDFDFTKDGLKLKLDGDILTADGTTLGGDNGIAVAMEMAVLASDDLAHPRIEAVFTTDEETGLFGAESIDVSMLKGKKFINIDSEDEGIFTVSCAGGVTAISTIPVTRQNSTGNSIKIKVAGLIGGHSGMEIHKERANASILMGRILYTLSDEIDFNLVSLEGGSADNVITKESVSEIIVSKDNLAKAIDIIDALAKTIKHEFRVSDGNINIQAVSGDEINVDAVTVKDTAALAAFLLNYPQGVQNMSIEIDGLVETSINLGIAKLTDDSLSLTSAIRSAVDSRTSYIAQKVSAMTKAFGGTIVLDGAYPGWEYMKDSSLRDLMIKVFEKQYGKPPVIEAIHAGLECGMFAQKIKDLDCISIGPDLRDVHTPDESMDIASVKRVWEFLVEVLKESK